MNKLILISIVLLINSNIFGNSIKTKELAIINLIQISDFGYSKIKIGGQSFIKATHLKDADGMSASWQKEYIVIDSGISDEENVKVIDRCVNLAATKQNIDSQNLANDSKYSHSVFYVSFRKSNDNKNDNIITDCGLRRLKTKLR